jgi:hypothetical protein
LSRRFVQVAAKSTRVFDETKFIRHRPEATIIQTQAVASVLQTQTVASVLQTQTVASVLQTQTVASGQNSSRLFGRDKIWVKRERNH